ncbi:MAG: TolC family protein [Pseudomonadales bacterium]
MVNSLQASETPGDILNAASAAEIAVRDSPSLAQMQARYEALTEIPSQVGALPDPTLNLNAINFPTDTFARDQEPMTQFQIGFSQEFPFPGKLSLRKEAAEFDAKAASYSVEELRLQLVSTVKNTWWQLFYLERALTTLTQNQALLRQFISVAKTKYETGMGLQQDVLLAQLELAKSMDQRIHLQAMRHHKVIYLNVLMDRPVNSLVVLPEQVSKAMPNIKSEDDLHLRSEATRPLLSKIVTDIDAAQARLDLAKRDYYPDFTVGMNYGDRSGDNALPRGGERADFLSLKLAVKIPLYAGRKQSKAVAQKTSELQSSRYTLQDKKGMVMVEISASIADYLHSREQFILFETGIVPLARQTVESMLVAYQVSEVDFLNLIRSQMTLFNYELQYWKTLTEAKQALARLQAAVGEESVYE